MIEPGKPEPMTLAEYDRLTPPEGTVYELFEGYLYAFSTGTGAHGILCTRIGTFLDTHVAAPCQAFAASTIGVRDIENDTGVVPDGSVACEDIDLQKTYITKPKLVVEVISKGSVHRDRVTKLDFYRALPSVDEYLMVDARKVWAMVTRRAPAGQWLDVTYTALDDRIDLLSIGLRIPMSDLYRGIQYPTQRRKKRT